MSSGQQKTGPPHACGLFSYVTNLMACWSVRPSNRTKVNVICFQEGQGKKQGKPKMQEIFWRARLRWMQQYKQKWNKTRKTSLPGKSCKDTLTHCFYRLYMQKKIINKMIIYTFLILRNYTTEPLVDIIIRWYSHTGKYI